MIELYQRFALIFFSLTKKDVSRKQRAGVTSFLLPPSSFLLFIFVSLFPFSFAQSTDDVINLAASHSAFARGLADRPGWNAVAYNTKNFYGIWRVEFHDAEGNYLGWADVNPEQQQVYGWYTEFDLLDGQYAEAEAALMNFARQDPAVIGMVGNVDENYGYWIGFDAWRSVWTLYIDRWPNSFELNIRSSSTTPRSLENLYLEKVLIQDVMSYEDWHNASSSQAVEIAFSAPEIAEAVRGKSWSTYAEHLEGNTWKIHFMSGEEQLAEADVNVDESSLIGFSLP